MLTDNDIEALYRDQESDRVERKASLSAAGKIKEAICAFANDYPGHGLPGVIIVGQNDDLSCAGIRVDAQLLETLGGWRADGNILPFPSMAVRRLTIDGCEVAAVIVEPSENTPVRLAGRTWIRVGPRRAVATAAEEGRLIERRQWRNLPTDAQAVGGATMDDLDLKRFAIEYLPAAFPPEILEQNGRTTQEQLRAIRFVDANGVPTLTALLMVGTEPTTFVPGAYVQFLAVNGPEITDSIRDQKVISGTIGDQIRILDELADLVIVTPAVIEAKRIDSPTYPISALQQLFRNALLHRNYTDSTAPVRVTWYSDRIEISSPGGPHGGVNSVNFGNIGVTSYRNPTLAEALKTLGFAERFGVGLQIVERALERNGNPPAEFRVDDHFVHVTVRARP